MYFFNLFDFNSDKNNGKFNIIIMPKYLYCCIIFKYLIMSIMYSKFYIPLKNIMQTASKLYPFVQLVKLGDFLICSGIIKIHLHFH